MCQYVKDRGDLDSAGRRASAVANREAGLPKNRVHAAKLSLSANPVVRYDAIGCDNVR